MLDCGNDYANIGSLQEPKWRVKTLLMKLESDRRTGTDYFSHKFMGKVQEIFSGLPKPKDVRSFEGNDLPLLFTASEVQQFALEHKLNKAFLESAPFTYAACSRQSASVNFSASVRASLQVLGA